MATAGRIVLQDASTELRLVKKAGLEYVNDSMPGIKRVKRGKGWIYLFADNSACSDGETILRIKSLTIPPAWKNVWICENENGHLQATGIDQKGRKQYKYHPQWLAMRSETKFYRMLQFGKALPRLRKCVERDLKHSTLNEKKVLALVVHLLDKTAIRIGNHSYEKLYGSYGLTTLRDKHVTVKGLKIKIRFIGKRGIQHELEVTNARLARLIKKCRDIPGQELFQYYDQDGMRRKLDSGMVNNYIKEATGENFTAKDFRTWKASVFALRYLLDSFSDGEFTNKDFLKCLDEVSGKLGNSRTICRKYYIHPVVVSAFENGVARRPGKTALKQDEGSYRFGEAELLWLLAEQRRSKNILKVGSH